MEFLQNFETHTHFETPNARILNPLAQYVLD